MSAFTTVNNTAPAAQAPVVTENVAASSHSPTINPQADMDDAESLLSDPPTVDENMPMGMNLDGVADHGEHPDHLDHATDEPNPKKRKRYNDPPNEVHAELRRPQLAGQWYSKSPEQWEELSHLHKLIYSHVGRIEETDLGEEVDPCEACRKRGFKCMKYKQDHPEVEKLYKGNVRVGTSCTRCRRYRRTCAPPGYKKPNGSISTPNRPQSNGYPVAPGTGDSGYKAQGADGINTWEDTLLAAASGGSPLTSVASTPEYEQPPPVEPLPPPVHQHQPIAPAHHPQPVVVPHHIPHPHSHLHPLPQHRPLPQPGFTPHDLEDVSQHVNKVAFLDKVHMVENELNELRATQADFNKERRHWQDEKRDLQSEIYHLREDQRKTREENWALQTKIVQLEKDALTGKGVDMDRIMAEAELKVENRQLKARLDALEKEARETKIKMKELKRVKKGLQRKLDGSGNGAAVVPTSSTSNGNVVDDDSSSDSSDDDDDSVDETTRVHDGMDVQ